MSSARDRRISFFAKGRWRRERPMGRISKRVDCVKTNADADSAVGDVKGGPLESSEIETEKIHDMSAEETIGKISRNPAQQEAKGDAERGMGICKMTTHEAKNDQSNRGEQREKKALITEYSPGCTGVVNKCQIEERGNDHNGTPPLQMMKSEPFGSLIDGINQQAEGECRKRSTQSSSSFSTVSSSELPKSEIWKVCGGRRCWVFSNSAWHSTV